jgi:hypothetical protein
MILGILTGFVLPVMFIIVFNLIIYFHLNKLQKNKSKQLSRITRRFYQRRNEKKLKLLRQFAVFISIFDTNDIVLEDIYLIIISFPLLSLLIITLMIINWNKSIQKSILNRFYITSWRRYSRSTTTVQFSTHLSYHWI